MSKPEINIISKMSDEKKKLLFIAPIAIVILIILIYFLLGGNNKNNVVKTNSNLDKNWEIPSDKKEELPNSTLEIYDEYDKHNRKMTSDSNKDFFSGLNETEDKSLNKLSKQEDIYNKVQEQLKTLDKNRDISSNTSRDNNRPRNNRTKPSKNTKVILKDDNKVDINDFFNKKSKAKPVVELNNYNETDAVIYAVIHNDQKIKSKDRIIMRLTKPATINNITYKENTIIYGFANITKNRVGVIINTIKNRKANLVAYDSQDGTLGLYVEGANASGEIASETIDDGIDEIDINGIPIGKTIKSVFKKRNKESLVTLLNNYEILLKTN